MRAGRLRHRVTIQEEDVQENEYGEEVPQWTDKTTVWAAIDETNRGFEERETDQTKVAELDATITIRYQDGIDETMRLKDTDSGDIYGIESVANVDKIDHEITLGCRKRG